MTKDDGLPAWVGTPPEPGVIRAAIAGPGEWSTFYGLPGWSGYEVRAVFDVIGGKVAPTSVQVNALDRQPVALTTKRLGLLLTELGAMVANLWESNSLTEARSKDYAVTTSAEKDVRAYATAEQVAEVWRKGHTDGVSALRAYVCEVLHMSTRTADRYIREARERGLIPTNPRQAPASGPAKKKENQK